MSRETIDACFRWMRSYLDEAEARNFHVSLHGGEPLTAGLSMIDDVEIARATHTPRPRYNVTLSCTTNALLLTDAWLEAFARADVSFGTSLDGPAIYHDTHRRDFSGKGTHRIVENKIHWLLSHPIGRKLFSGALCVIHPDMDGKKLIRYFYDLGLRKVDLLLPDQNHIHGSPAYPSPDSSLAYAKVLIGAYQEWRRIDDPTFHIRKFEMLIGALFGEQPSLDSLGNGPITVFTIETDGNVQPVDTMRICGDGFAVSPSNIDAMKGRQVEDLELVKLGLNKWQYRAKVCETCDHERLCGGGYLPHRYSKVGFRETVYCRDMIALCTFIQADVSQAFAHARRRAAAPRHVDRAEPASTSAGGGGHAIQPDEDRSRDA